MLPAGCQEGDLRQYLLDWLRAKARAATREILDDRAGYVRRSHRVFCVLAENFVAQLCRMFRFISSVLLFFEGISSVCDGRSKKSTLYYLVKILNNPPLAPFAHTNHYDHHPSFNAIPSCLLRWVMAPQFRVDSFFNAMRSLFRVLAPHREIDTHLVERSLLGASACESIMYRCLH